MVKQQIGVIRVNSSNLIRVFKYVDGTFTSISYDWISNEELTPEDELMLNTHDNN